MYKVAWKREKLGKFFESFLIDLFNFLKYKNYLYNNKSNSVPSIPISELFFSPAMCHQLKSCAICQLFVKRKAFHMHMSPVDMNWVLQWVLNVVQSQFLSVNILNTKICMMNLKKKSAYCQFHGNNHSI